MGRQSYYHERITDIMEALLIHETGGLLTIGYSFSDAVKLLIRYEGLVFSHRPPSHIILPWKGGCD